MQTFIKNTATRMFKFFKRIQLCNLARAYDLCRIRGKIQQQKKKNKLVKRDNLNHMEK